MNKNKSAFQVAWEQKQELKKHQAKWNKMMKDKLTSRPFAVLASK
jgi:hypothetical protein